MVDGVFLCWVYFCCGQVVDWVQEYWVVIKFVVVVWCIDDGFFLVVFVDYGLWVVGVVQQYDYCVEVCGMVFGWYIVYCFEQFGVVGGIVGWVVGIVCVVQVGCVIQCVYDQVGVVGQGWQVGVGVCMVGFDQCVFDEGQVGFGYIFYVQFVLCYDLQWQVVEYGLQFFQFVGVVVGQYQCFYFGFSRFQVLLYRLVNIVMVVQVFLCGGLRNIMFCVVMVV